jgi:hypothetical protein
VSAREGRTVAELLDDSDGLAREALLDMSADRALGMVRGWPQLIQSAALLWADLPPDPTDLAGADPIALLAAMGRAIGRSLAARHWPGRGPRDEAWEQIASNLVQARRLLQQKPVASEPVSTGGQIDPTAPNSQILHVVYVAAHAATVALTEYQRDLQHRLEIGARRRQPFVERPTVLEVESAGGMIARFDAIEQLAADHPGLAAPARIIAMRAQGEAEVAIEQGETRFEGVRWVSPRQIADNQVIPLPEPARRGLVNAATDVAAATNQAVAAAAHLAPTKQSPRVGADGTRRVGRAATDRETPVHQPNRGSRPR